MTDPLFSVDGRVILVTGGSRGLGREMALAISEAGADCVLVGRDQASLAETVVAMSQAVLEDPRFLTNPVTFDELFDLDIELSILSPLTPAPSPMEFDLVNDGIYLTHGERSGPRRR